MGPDSRAYLLSTLELNTAHAPLPSTPPPLTLCQHTYRHRQMCVKLVSYIQICAQEVGQKWGLTRRRRGSSKWKRSHSSAVEIDRLRGESRGGWVTGLKWQLTTTTKMANGYRLSVILAIDSQPWWAVSACGLRQRLKLPAHSTMGEWG